MPGRGRLPMSLCQEREKIFRQYYRPGKSPRQAAEEIFDLKLPCFHRASSIRTIYEFIRRRAKKGSTWLGFATQDKKETSIPLAPTLIEQNQEKSLDEFLGSAAFRELLKTMPLGEFDKLARMLKEAWPRKESEAVARLKQKLEESNLHVKELQALKCQEPEAHKRVRDLEEQVQRLRRHAREAAQVGGNGHMPSPEKFMVHHAGRD